jgi:hypothetical protein
VHILEMGRDDPMDRRVLNRKPLCDTSEVAPLQRQPTTDIRKWAQDETTNPASPQNPRHALAGHPGFPQPEFVQHESGLLRATFGTGEKPRVIRGIAPAMAGRPGRD